jgi:hypothetical protein
MELFDLQTQVEADPTAAVKTHFSKDSTIVCFELGAEDAASQKLRIKTIAEGFDVRSAIEDELY